MVLDFHNYEEIQYHPDEHRERFFAIWRQIAARYRNCDSSVYYEVLNEPCVELNYTWNEFLKDAVKEIRKIDPYHTLITSGAQWGNIYGLADLKMPEGEENIICTFHTYYPIPFTHQGVDFATEEFRYMKGISWPGPPKKPLKIDRRLMKYKWFTEWVNMYQTLPYEENPAGPTPILNEFDLAEKWEKENSVPIWLGEFGVNKIADMQSRIKWTEFLVQECKKRGYTWAYWDFGGNCSVYNIKRGKWEEGLLKVLFQ